MHARTYLLLGDFWLGNLKNEDPGRLHAVLAEHTCMHVAARACTWLHVQARGGTCMHEDARLSLIAALRGSDFGGKAKIQVGRV